MSLQQFQDLNISALLPSMIIT